MKSLQPTEWIIIVNPNAGVGKGRKDWSKISSLLNKYGFAFSAVFTEKRNHAIYLVQEKISEGSRKIIVVGGDGTMNEVVNGVFQQKLVPTNNLTLGMISVGTGNDWGRTFNIPLNYEQAICAIKQEETLLQDAGIVKFHSNSTVTNRYFINMAGIGFDAMVALKTNSDKEKGKKNPILYLKNLIISLFSYKSSSTYLEIDGKEIRHKLFSVGVGIGRYNGGGMQQAPGAVPNDGFFALTIIKHMSPLRVIASVRRLYNGTIEKHKRVETHKAKNIRIDSKTPILLEADGESLGHSPFEFSIVPQSLRVIINNGNCLKKSA